MGSSPMTLSQAADLTNKAIQKIFLKDKGVTEEYFRKMYNVTTGVTDLYMKDSSLSGLGEAARVTEQAFIKEEVPVQGFDQTYTQVLYAKITAFTWYMWKFGIKKRDLTRVVKSLKGACYRIRERLLAEKYDAAHLSSYTASDDSGSYTVTTSGGDAVAMASASHTREDGGTAWSNLESDGTTANQDLDYDALKGLDRIGALVKTPKGGPMMVNYNRIVVKKGSPPAWRAKEILGALKRGMIPGEFSNDGSAVNTFELVENPFLLGTGDTTSTTNLSSATNWHAIDTNLLSDEYGPQYFESEAIKMADAPKVVFKTNEIQFKAEMAFAYGHNDPRATAHSEGDS